MKGWLYAAFRHTLRYGIGYFAGLFVLIAAMTCGVLRENSVYMAVQVQFGGALRILLSETVFAAGLLLAATHPFGCAISLAVVAVKGYQAGLSIGWWLTQNLKQPLWLILIGLQGMISLITTLSACCMTAYTALRISYMNQREYIHRIMVLWAAQLCCAILRWIICVVAL